MTLQPGAPTLFWRKHQRWIFFAQDDVNDVLEADQVVFCDLNMQQDPGVDQRHVMPGLTDPNQQWVLLVGQGAASFRAGFVLFSRQLLEDPAIAWQRIGPTPRQESASRGAGHGHAGPLREVESGLLGQVPSQGGQALTGQPPCFLAPTIIGQPGLAKSLCGRTGVDRFEGNVGRFPAGDRHNDVVLASRRHLACASSRPWG